MLLGPARPSVMGCEESQEPALQYSVIQPSRGVANTMPFLSQFVISPPRLTPSRQDSVCEQPGTSPAPVGGAVDRHGVLAHGGPEVFHVRTVLGVDEIERPEVVKCGQAGPARSTVGGRVERVPTPTHALSASRTNRSLPEWSNPPVDGVTSTHVRPPSVVRAGTSDDGASDPGFEVQRRAHPIRGETICSESSHSGITIGGFKAGGAGGRQTSCRQATRSILVKVSCLLASQTVCPAAAIAARIRADGDGPTHDSVADRVDPHEVGVGPVESRRHPKSPRSRRHQARPEDEGQRS